MANKRILLVDDEPAITSALTVILQRAGYDTAVATSGADALTEIATRPDLVILDIMLPDIDGYQVCRTIRQQPTYIPVLMLTARDTLPDKVLGLELGADAYLTKPFAPGELLAQVRALFRLVGQMEGEAGETRPLRCGPLALFPDLCQVQLDGVAVDLTPKEYALLHLFMQRPGYVFGRETLLREVWGYEYLGDSRTVDVHVQRLRTKIEKDSSQPELLLTVRGFGYRLVGSGK